MQLNCSGISLKINELKTSLGNINDLNKTEIFKLEGFIDLANMHGSDESAIEEGQELNKLVELIKINFQDRSGMILSKLGLSGNAQEISKGDQGTQNIVEKKESPIQKTINEALQDPKFANDKIFQKHVKYINALDNKMQAIEREYNITRGSFSSAFNLPDEKYDEYRELSTSYERYAPMINDYIKEMNEWKDGPAYEIQQRGRVTFTNVERITLKNGQHAWKSNEGVFYPFINGKIGNERVEDPSLYS